MNDHEKDREDEIPELKLEKDVLNEGVPEVEIDDADIILIDENQQDLAAAAPDPEPRGPGGQAAPEIEIDASDITMIEDQADGGTEETAETGPDPQNQDPGREASPEAPVDEPGFEFLDYRSFERSKATETPALDRKIQRSLEGDSSEPPPQAGFSTRKLKPGDIVFSEGDPGNEAYLILSGQVKITRQYKKKSMKINQLGAGQIFGEMAIITGEPRTATAEALEPTEVFIITEKKLNENLSHNLAIVKSLIDQLIDRLKQLLKQQSTMLNKVERAMLIDKKMEVLKAQVKAYRKKKSPEEIDEKLKSLFETILKI